MNYLIDARYKTLHSLAVHLGEVIAIYERGDSLKLYPTVKEIQTLLPLLETYQSPPFSKEESLSLEAIHKELSPLLHLPQDLLPRTQMVLHKLEEFLLKLEAFTLNLEAPESVEKSYLLDLLHNLKLYLQVHLLDLEGKAHSIIHEKEQIRLTLQELVELPQECFTPGGEKDLLNFLLAAKFFEEKDSLEATHLLLQRTLDLEFSLQHHESWYSKELEEKLSKLLQETLKAEEFISSEEPLFTKFKEHTLSPLAEETIMKLQEKAFPQEPLQLMTNTVLFSYRVLKDEAGDTLASRCRFVEFFRLFTSSLEELYSFFLKAS